MTFSPSKHAFQKDSNNSFSSTRNKVATFLAGWLWNHPAFSFEKENCKSFKYYAVLFCFFFCFFNTNCKTCKIKSCSNREKELREARYIQLRKSKRVMAETTNVWVSSSSIL
jgi:hypothetical protein